MNSYAVGRRRRPSTFVDEEQNKTLGAILPFLILFLVREGGH